ncbi:serine/threonine protein kinase [Actinomadura graeca]|uniref:non-specific serine/threonine protein kinase n=1 Tax=Actinomadura graeca TaxID=2750812 RepID=A0ABX8QNJ0_9ACTN|nr:serine/threonine-protein kinase [Actinomadura graeca]QXJ20163.1 serine/threonine protein kinase [Actinomadura graeca]
MTWDVPGYSVVRVLSDGPAGRVVQASRDGFGERVVILDRAPVVQDEARLLTTLRDPHVVRVHEYVERRRALVMELVDAVSLERMIGESGPMAPEAALRVLKGCLLGLAAAHELGVVHRNLTPASVLVVGGSCKVTGFGIDMPGTPGYQAPERGDEITPAGDLYAAAAIFSLCLTGQPPGRLRLDQLPERMRGLVARGMARNPLARPKSAAAFAALVDAVAQNRWVRPSAEPAPSAATEDEARPGLVKPMAAVIAVGLVCGGGAYGIAKAVDKIDDDDPAPPAPAVTRKAAPPVSPAPVQAAGISRGRLAYAVGVAGAATGRSRMDVALSVAPAVVPVGGAVTLKVVERRVSNGCPPGVKWNVGDGQGGLWLYPRSAGPLPAGRSGTPVKASVLRPKPKVSVKGCVRTTVIRSTYTFKAAVRPGAYLLSPWSPPRVGRVAEGGARSVSKGRLPALTVR